ncbi:hypothetical protein Spp001_18 [Shewanella phage Spp001]|uniref:Uncharacterized protein n=1 Tax=Shewanella phage Spp001 TaxID=1445859 RepID=W6E9G8_9CAUD|nr:hypothetical protein Spp001_18 [Shewanella phage Spp001]AHJ10526.1 hypothetical protein Spp001_18 [Shewanella phage Spp001]
MQVKNDTEHYLGFTVRMNAGEKVHGIDAHGNKITKDAPPDLRSIRIPAGATVELADDVWAKALETKSQRQGIELVLEEVQAGARKESNVAPEKMSVVHGDGNFKTFYPVRELVTERKLVIIEKPACKLTVEQMREKIADAQGYPLPKDVSDELITAQYERMFG